MSESDQPNQDELIFTHKESPILPEATTPEQKHQNWDAMKVFLSGITDRIGRHIEPGIIDTVTALNLLEIDTDSSCEGHRNEFNDEEFNSPHVRIRPPFPPGLQEEAELTFELEDKLREEYESSQKPNRELYEKLNIASDRGEELAEALRDISNIEKFKLQKMLDQFYAETPEAITPQTKLVVSRIAYSPLIISVGGESINTLPSGERPIVLKALQAEMARFTDFLKRKYFEGK